jgi:hypothetical protein
MKESSPARTSEKRRHPKAGQWEKIDKRTERLLIPYAVRGTNVGKR